MESSFLSRSDGVEMELPCEAERVIDVRRAVAQYASSLGMTKRTIEKLEVAVSEAVANCVRHAYCATDRQPIVQVAFRCDGESLIIDVVDRGCGFAAPADGVVPEVDLGREGGLGIILIKRFMDRVSYVSGAGQGTRLRMEKRLPRAVRGRNIAKKLNFAVLA